MSSRQILDAMAEMAATAPSNAGSPDRSIREATKHAASLLASCGLKCPKDELERGLALRAGRYGVAEDAGKILWYIREKTTFRPKSIDNFWAYVATVMKYPPYEPVSHIRDRKGTRPLESREWRFLMDIKRFPRTIREHPPEWLDAALNSSPAFDRVHERYVAEARHIVSGQVDGGGVGVVDASEGFFVEKGQHIMDADLESMLARLEGE